MKQCPVCHQQLSEDVALCPLCGKAAPAAKTEFEGYRIIENRREIGGIEVYRVRNKADGPELLLRIYGPRDSLSPDQVQRFQQLLETVNAIDSPRLVRSSPLMQAAGGEWYRTSEWVEVVTWGDLISSGLFTDSHRQREVIELFRQLALAVHELHQHGLLNPQMTHDDFLLFRDGEGALAVKLDYKYSQLIQDLSPINHLSDEKVKSRHPDFIARRPLDVRSDVWSLGYLMIELLSHKDKIRDYAEEAKRLDIHRKVRLLLHQMVDPDPDLRPSTLLAVAEQLASMADEAPPASGKRSGRQRLAPWREMRRLSRSMLVLACILLVTLGGTIWLTLTSRKDETALMMEYANRYNRSIAFVAVEYALRSPAKEYYRSVASGTAFLADREGHLLSNRHVVCPWTEDQSFDRALRELLSLGETPLFTCRHLLWFEGEKAFKKASVLSENTQLQDHFYIENAFRSDGQPSVRIAGVLPEPQGLGQRIRSPLGDDAAVLKIDRVPGSLEPLSLASPKELEKIGNLAPVMVLGFPLSIEAQEDNRVKANATMGHVRRNYPAVIQVNASIHSGNSGGPVIGLDGRVIGIATAVKTSRGLLISSGLSDFGLILPVNRALPLLESVRAGKAAWDGLPDPALPATLKAIETAARRGRWQEAMAAVEAGMKQRRVPSVFYLAGLLYLSQGDIARARAAYRDLASIAAGDALPRFFLSLCDWMQNIPQSSDQRYLLDRTWRSSGEYYGFLARVLEGKVPLEAALHDCEDRNEVVQSHYVVSLIQQRQGNLAAAEQTLREGLLNAKSDDRNALLLQAQLRRIQAQRLGSLKDAGQKQKYELECRQFQERLQSHVQNQEALAKQSDALWQTIRGLDNSDTSDPAILTAALKQKAELFKDLLKLDPEAHYIQWILGFVHAQLGDWAEAGNWLDSYLSRSGREQGSRLAAGLLRAQITYWRAGEHPGTEALRSFAQKTSDPWYRNLALCLLGEMPVEQLIRQSEDEPPEKVTLQVALGIQMEQKGEKERGIQHYSEALESYLDNWMEFEYARARIILLRGEK